MNTPFRLLVLSLLSSLLLLIGCGGSSSGPNATTGKLSLGVTDAPVDNADAVVISFTGIELLDAQGGVSQSFDLQPPQAIDLLKLQGSNSQLLISDVDVPAGVYQEVRLSVESENSSCQNLVAPFASYITINGTQNPLVVPSGGSSGFKVKGPLTIATGGAASYVIDFDLRKSISQRGGTGCFNLKPVLRVVDTSQIGSLVGTVDGDLLQDSSCTADVQSGEGAAVYLFAGAGVTPDDVDGTDPEPLSSALLVAKNDQSGDFSYAVGFLTAGDYTAAFSCTAGADDPETNDAGVDPATDTVRFGNAVDVVISVDTVTTADFLLQSPQATPAP